jgi:hypothetical protein
MSPASLIAEAGHADSAPRVDQVFKHLAVGRCGWHEDLCGWHDGRQVNRSKMPTNFLMAFWRRCAGPRHRVSASKRTPSGETAWGPEVLQFRLWAEQRGCRGGRGSRPVRLNSATQQRTPLRRQLRLCIAQTICSYHSRLGRKGAILLGLLGRG